MVNVYKEIGAGDGVYMERGLGYNPQTDNFNIDNMRAAYGNIPILKPGQKIGPEVKPDKKVTLDKVVIPAGVENSISGLVSV